METATQLIDDILDMELAMFLDVPSDGQRVCQQYPERFKFHRHLQFSIWSTGTLSCYRKDLRRARQNGANLMTIKYARTQGAGAPPQHQSPDR